MDALPIGSDCFAPLKPGGYIGYRGKLVKYFDHETLGQRALLDIGDKRTIHCSVKYLTLWDNKPAEPMLTEMGH